MPYNVYIVNGLSISAPMNRATLSQNQISIIYFTLLDHFNQVVKAHDALRDVPKYGSASIQLVASYPNVLQHELLVYLLPPGTTLVKNGKLEKGKPPPGHDGFTNSNLNGKSGSEVYFNFSDAKLLANLIFHECMHNKLRLGNVDLHSRGGMGDGPSGGTGPITSNTRLSKRNINDMAAVLHVSQPQWTDGIKLLVAEWMRPDSDPAKGTF